MPEQMVCEFKILQHHFTIYFLTRCYIPVFLNTAISVQAISFKNWFAQFVCTKHKFTILSN